MEAKAEGNSAKLIQDISADALDEAAKIKADAERNVQERIRQFERQMEEIRAEAEQAAAAQSVAIERTLQAGFTVEIRRLALRSRDQALKSVLGRVEEKMARLVSAPAYREFLQALIVEAVIGLGADRVSVNASPPELKLLDDDLLEKAVAQVKKLVMRSVTIKKSQDPPLLLQGIVLSADDGKTAYNNQIRTRLLRRQSDIRKLIYDRLGLRA